MKEETKQMGLMKKLTSAIVASSLVLSLVGSAFAAYTPAAGETAGNRMMALKILTGRPGNDPLALKEEITRAELVTVIVRAFGQEDNAKLLAGAPAYPDTAKHWASGNIAMAKALIEKQGESMGMPDGSFAPDAKLTPAQAVAFLMKFLGVKPEANKTWPANYLDAAVTAGLITAADKAVIAPIQNDNATRGLVFYVFDNAFYSYNLGAGKTFYTKYVDTAAPVITLNNVEKTTLDSKVTISGKAEGAKEVYVGTTAVTVAADGTFSGEFALAEFKEYTITVTARDIAGNAAEKAVSVTRTVGTVDKIEAAAITVAAGATVDVAAKAVDAKGNTVTTTITGESTVGTFADGKFTAGKAAGTGTLTLKAGEKTATVNVTVTAGALAKVEADKASVAPGAIVSLTAKDEFGNVISGATYTQASGDAMLDGVNGKFMASKPGNYTVTATAGGVSKNITIGVYSTTLSKFQVSAPANLIANNASTADITVTAVDANGNVITNYEGDFHLSAAGSLQYKAADGSWNALNSATPFTIKTGGTKTITVRSTGVIGGQIVNVQANKVGDTTANKSTVSVELVEQAATSVTVSFTESYLPNNMTGTSGNNFKAVATVKVLDQAGKLMKSGAYAVKLAVAGPATLDGAVSDGTKTVTFIGGATNPTVNVLAKRAESGTVTVTANSGGLTAGTATINAQSYGTAAKLVVTPVTETSGVANSKDILVYKVQVADANGVPVVDTINANVDFNVAVEVSDSLAAQVSLHAANINYDDPATSLTSGWQTLSRTDKVAEFLDGVFNGSGTAYVYVRAAGFTGNLNLTFKDVAVSGALAATTSTATFKADTYSAISVTGGALVPVAAPTSAVTLQLHDGSGNKVAAADVELVVKVYTSEPQSSWTASQRSAALATDVSVNGTAVGTSGIKVKTDANGAATINVTLPGYVGRDRWIEVTGTQADGSTDLVAKSDSSLKAKLSVVNYVASSIALSLSNTDYTVTKVSEEAGQVVRVKAVVKDPNGVALGGALYPVKLYVKEGKAYQGDSGTTFVGSSGYAMTYDTDSNGNGFYYADVRPTTAGRVVFEVKDANPATAITASTGIGVRAVAVKATGTGANPSSFRVIVSEAKDATSSAPKTLSKNTPVPVTLTVVDTYGNTVVAPYDLRLTLAAMDGSSADALIAFRASETGVNTTTAKIASGSTSTTIYVIGGVGTSTTGNAFDMVVTGYYDTDGDGTNQNISVDPATAEPTLGTGTSYLKVQ